MSEVGSYTPGMPAWVELATSDPEGARRFYRELFGWEFQTGSADSGQYTTCLVRGHTVAGIAGEPAPAEIPTAWTTYLASGDVDDMASRISAAGGRLTAEPVDAMDEGRMAIAVDPTGAVFGLWQADKHLGASLVSEPGAVSWTELQTGDLDMAQPSTRRYSATTGRRPPAGCGTQPSRSAVTGPAVRWASRKNGTPETGPARAG
jgi:uncharacterized protein